MPTECLTYTRYEARRLLGLGESAFDEAIKRGDIPSIRVGRRVLIPKIALQQLVETAPVGGKAS